MPYLVDGSNLGGLLGGSPGARDRAGVLRLLLSWARGRRRVVVVFDGPADPALARTYGPLEVRFGGARSADDAILAALGRRPADWWVVSDDRALLAACSERGARTVAAAELLGKLTRAATAEEERGEGAIDVEEWEDWFRRGGG
ncbi:MAG TPA: NYN domain-containing protein [Thermoanaerobaculia bacterium]|nr:NYN domain-containing protein [Thermoanaerobaculia bacterium]